MPTPTINVPKTLADPQFLGTTIATLYTAPSGQDGVRLTALLLMNQTTSWVTARVHHVPSGRTAAPPHPPHTANAPAPPGPPPPAPPPPSTPGAPGCRSPPASAILSSWPPSPSPTSPASSSPS